MGANWKIRENKIINFPTTYLTQAFKAWHYFSSARLFPSRNISEVTHDRALLKYAIHMGKLIFSSLTYIIRGTTSIGLGHPSLVYTLCVVTGVRGEQTEE
ncbi:hypothetical protein IEQ34_005923 [Dendrobium chrysotoxum]|uniref:Putative plant transposon protein domain-containing protein n=1 Tax=Dendrobium chrysotoxum TaxID=161865 RepID=A0AAV7HCG7_DENCH|nr:hypothetical protein IEQ34_005923 [Dendrobium chrysotoxum]